jgi:hypothetical protein
MSAECLKKFYLATITENASVCPKRKTKPLINRKVLKE